MQLALRRHGGDLQMAYRSVGRALLLCGATAIAGFGSLAWSSNAGMASLGQVCAVGIAGNMLISIFLLPVWWHELVGPRSLFAVHGSGLQASAPPLAPRPSPLSVRPASPSFLYRSAFWRLGQSIVRVLPRDVSAWICCRLAGAYWFLARHRREIVSQNLMPPLEGKEAAAKKATKQLFHNFALKLTDLWRFEAGLPIDGLLGEATGWEHLEAARAQGRGVLLLTPHLGNWEFGGPWLTRRGIPLQVITLAEPGPTFTELRRASRARWSIDTFVIGDDPFAFVGIIRRLEGGATVALLVDRPPPATAVEVELFGRPFPASIAAAELARASGCALVPVYLPRGATSYSAHILSPVAYDRAALRDRYARIELTQKIMRALEPAIRQHLDQWYHFVPVWPAK
jgi:KDO2-lipid IV(A) lauroyltransferase